MIRRAIVISTAGKAEARVGCFLSLLGIEWEALTAAALLSRHQLEILAGREIQACLIVCGDGLRELQSELNKSQIPAPVIGRAFSGSLFHSFDYSPASLGALENFIDGAKIAVPKLSSEHLRYRITDKHPDMCGALTGLSFLSSEKAVNCGIEIALRDGFADTVISINEASILTVVGQGSRELFVASSPEILDLQEATSTNIDYRTCFSRVVPILIALRHLFRGACWAPEAHYANIIIDDPPLWQRYGYLVLRELADLVDRSGCACTIAMIPWNYRRSDRRAVSLVTSRQPRLGVCVHGCNHTGAEFGCKDRKRLTELLLTAGRRMDAHQQHTGLPCQPVMVFPQGVFSIEAMSCLRTGGYLAAANTEVADCWGQGYVTLQDLLQPAVVCYEGPPLFIRRRPESGAANFAVDSFLGKPCLVVLHHDFFKDGIKSLEQLVGTFTNFHPRLSWDNLEDIVTGCALRKLEADGRKTVRIFGDRALIRVGDMQGEKLTIIKNEADDSKISRVEIDDQSVDFLIKNGLLRVNLEPRARATVSLRIVTAANPAIKITEDSMGEKARIAMRRYLSEFRDKYPAQSETFLRYASRVARSLQRR